MDWYAIYKLAVKQGVAAFIFDGLQAIKNVADLPAEAFPPKVELMMFYTHAMQIEKRHACHAEVIRKLSSFYASHNIKMMVLKGYGLSLSYPNPSHRPCGDIDLWLYGEQDRADDLLEKEENVKVDRSRHHHTVFDYEGAIIENHYYFFNIYTHRSNAEIETEFQELARQESDFFMLEDSKVFLPSPDFNALFLLRHMGGHFTCDDMALRQLTDWAMFVMSQHDKIDWERLLNTMRKQKMLRFFYASCAICVNYLGVPQDVFPPLERDEELENRVIQNVLYPAFGDKSALQKNFFINYSFRFRRWWANRWKHSLVYRDNIVSTFFMQIRSHLIKPEGMRKK